MGTVIAIMAVIVGATMIGVVFNSNDSRQLQKRFIDMGILQGKTLDEVVAKVGNPNSITATNNKKIYQWIRPKYHMALVFDDNNVCQGVATETVTN